jgi:aminopeptidase N
MQMPAVTALLLLAQMAWADTYPRQSGIDAQHYVFRISLRDDSNEITGNATADLLFTRDGVTDAQLDLAATMTVTAASTEYTRVGDRVVFRLSPPPKAGERRKFTIEYRGVPAKGLVIGPNKHGERCFFSVNWPDLARQWLPLIDHPSDKATSEFLVTAPAKYQVVANGLLQEELDLEGGMRMTHWKQSAPIASWLNAIGVAPFAHRDVEPVLGIPMQTWVFRQDRDAAAATFDIPARRALEFYVSHIGPYPYEKLANIQAAGLGGGTEHASAIFYGQQSVTGRPATNLVAHEIAHQWFGDSVTEKDWDDVWLSEGFATYFTLLCTEHHDGRDAMVAGLQRSRATVFQTEKRLPQNAVVHRNISDMRGVLNQLVYQKGGWVLHMLRSEIGSETFWRGIREYYRTYRDRNASTADFRRLMEETAGRDLGWFFDQWLYRAGSPAVEGGWHYDPASRKVAVDLAQTQVAEAYRLPLEVAIDGRVERVTLSSKQQRFEWQVEKEPVSVVLDPGTWVLMDAKFEKR